MEDMSGSCDCGGIVVGADEAAKDGALVWKNDMV